MLIADLLIPQKMKVTTLLSVLLKYDEYAKLFMRRRVCNHL